MNKDEIESALNITTISTDPDISEPLLYVSWAVKDGLLCLVGISEWYADENNINHLVTLDNVHYSEKDSKEIYDAFIAKYSRLKRIWESSHSKGRYSKKHFIEWALRNKRICKITWLNDAVNQGLISSDFTKPVKDMKERERNSLYRIIAVLRKTLLSISSEKAEEAEAIKKQVANQTALIDYLVANYGSYEGVSKSNLDKVFPLVQRHMD